MQQTVTGKIIKLWCKAAELEEKIANEFIDEDFSSYKSYITTDLNDEALKLLDCSVFRSTIQTSELEYDSFLNRLRLEDENRKNFQNRWAIEYGGLHLGFPLFQVLDKGKTNKLISLFNINLSSVNFQTTPFLEIITNDDSSLVPEFTISEDVWENFLHLPKYIYEPRFLKLSDLWHWLSKMFEFFGIHCPKAAGSFNFLQLYTKIEQQLAKVAQTHNLKLLPKMLVYYRQERQATKKLRQELDKLSQNVLWNQPQSINPAHHFFYKDQAHKVEIKKDLQQIDFDQDAVIYDTELSKSSYLSLSQKEILKSLLNRPLTSVIGPPGTGKTTLLKFLAVSEFCKYCSFVAKQSDDFLPNQALVVIASLNNLAVDQALISDPIKNKKQFLPSIRMGSRYYLVTQSLKRLQESLDFLNENHSSDEILWQKTRNDILDFDISIYGLDNMFHKARDFHTQWVIKRRKSIIELITQLMQEIQDESPLRSLYSDKKRRLFWATFPIIGTTLLSFYPLTELVADSVNLCLIDEASQNLPSHIIPLLFRSKKALLLGDVNQILPVVKTTLKDWYALAENMQLSKSFIDDNINFFPTTQNLISGQALIELNNPHILKLKEHFRCRPQIIEFCKKLCGYDLKVVAPKVPEVISELKKSAFWYLDLDSAEEYISNSWQNLQEAQAIIQLLNWIISRLLKDISITVLTPYRPQKELLERLIRSQVIESRSIHLKAQIHIATIHSFQGRESDCIVFSSTLSQRAHYFLNNSPNLLNVAVSRAKYFFIQVGSIKNLDSGSYTKLLKQFLLNTGQNIYPLLQE